jgi:hypothetical protein
MIRIVTCVAGVLVAGGVLIPAVVANAETSAVTGSVQVSGRAFQPAWPVLDGPRCPEKTPPGGEFIRTVQPPYGLPYDLYRVPGPGGSYKEVQVYC